MRFNLVPVLFTIPWLAGSPAANHTVLGKTTIVIGPRGPGRACISAVTVELLPLHRVLRHVQMPLSVGAWRPTSLLPLAPCCRIHLWPPRVANSPHRRRGGLAPMTRSSYLSRAHRRAAQVQTAPPKKRALRGQRSVHLFVCSIKVCGIVKVGRRGRERSHRPIPAIANRQTKNKTQLCPIRLC